MRANLNVIFREGPNLGRPIWTFLLATSEYRELLYDPDLFPLLNFSFLKDESQTDPKPLDLLLEKASYEFYLHLLVNGFLPMSFCDRVKLAVGYKYSELFKLYVDAFRTLQQGNYDLLLNLLKTESWLCTAKDENGNTLLHHLVNYLNTFDHARLLHFQAHNKELLELLEPCRTIKNNNNETPAQRALNTSLKNPFELR